MLGSNLYYIRPAAQYYSCLLGILLFTWHCVQLDLLSGNRVGWRPKWIIALVNNIPDNCFNDLPVCFFQRKAYCTGHVILEIQIYIREHRRWAHQAAADCLRFKHPCTGSCGRSSNGGLSKNDDFSPLWSWNVAQQHLIFRHSPWLKHRLPPFWTHNPSSRSCTSAGTFGFICILALSASSVQHCWCQCLWEQSKITG